MGGPTPGPASAHEIRRWLEAVWTRAEAAVLLQGGDDGPLAERRLQGELLAPEALAELRELTTTGEYRDGICRCHGSLTVALLGADGDFIGSGSLHGGTDIAWERHRFRNNLEVADPERLLAFLERHGAYPPLS
jgi:hypothetical protein